MLEAARFAGATGFAASVAGEIVGRVYGELDARQIADPRHPTPGVAREYWPLDLDTWASCEGYGWGANTASLLVRQVFGFTEGPYLDNDALDSRLIFELRPGLPTEFLVPGREYWLRNLPYRGARLTVGYRVAPAPDDRPGDFSALEILVSAGVRSRCHIGTPDAPSDWDGHAEDVHQIPGLNGAAYTIALDLES